MIGFFENETVVNEILKVKNELNRSIKSSEKLIYEPLKEMIDSGGKLIRPGLTILAASYGTYDSKRIVKIATSIEMLHMATLIHDDIIDKADTRRGIPSIQAKYSSEMAVYLGDYLFAKTFKLISSDYNKVLFQNLSKAIMSICKGEIRQYSYRFEGNTSVIKYLKLIAGKTAALFSIAMYAGANEANVDENKKRLLAKIGLSLGMAYQIIDDCLDFSDEEKMVKKNIGNDLTQGYVTLPLLYAMSENIKIEKIVEKKTITKKDIENLYEMVKNTDGLKRARLLADKYTKRAYGFLSQLDENEYTYELKRVMDKLLKREY